MEQTCPRRPHKIARPILRFLGIVGFWDSLFLPLRAGENEVAFVVTDETNGGTAAAARFAPDAAVAMP